ncbi:MAG: DNA primase [Opitutaceae bacterium]|jgi:DNA primase|nr:DNA primase [Opitutaceae bacterium]
MASIKPTCIRDLKFRVNVADVVSRVVTLRNAGGRRLKGLCPFHQEKTPSFHVDSDKGFYKCFGCGKAGDIITFVRETEMLTFTEAVEALGKRFAVPIEYEEGSGPTREERSLRQELFDLHDAATEHFHQIFKAGEETGNFMRGYWTDSRRFPMELAEEFKIGAVGGDGGGLAGVLLRKKFSEEALRKCGLFFISDDRLLTLGALRPRFRGRLMIPIRDHQGRVVAFTARQTKLTPSDDPASEAKYVNSPETPVFTKGNILFNLDRARTAAGEGRPFVLVEGQLDAMRCWSVGLKTAVAPQGTAITDNQLALLRRYHPKVECLLDGDSAGQKAALRFLPLALKAGLEVKFLALAGDAKVDPDDLFRDRGIAAYDELRQHALSAMAFACRGVLPAPEEASAEQKSRACQTLFDVISAAGSEVTQAEFLTEIAARLRLPVSAVQRDFDVFRRHGHARAQSVAAAQARANAADGGESHPGEPGLGEGFDSAPDGATGPAAGRPTDLADTPEYHLLLLCLRFEKFGKLIAHTLPHEWIDTSHMAGALLNRFLNEFEHDAWPGRDHLDTLIEDEREKMLLASILFDCPRAEDRDRIEDPARVINQALSQIRARVLEPELRQIELALASHNEDSRVDAISLIKRRTELQRQLRIPFGLPAVA